MWRRFPLLLACVLVGCGPSDLELRERTLSLLNTEADRWDGGKDFATSAVDAYGNPISASVTEGILNNRLEVRSHGRDGLPKNTDDIEVDRTKRHHKSVVSDQAVQDIGKVSGGVAKGTIDGIKQGFGFGRKGQP
jgi:hypothetical protein